MRIVAITDIHGSYRKVLEILSGVGPFDLLVIGGDLTTMGTREEATAAIEQFQRLGGPVLVVAGNMDPPELDELFVEKGVSIDGRGVVIGDAGIFGVSAAPLSPLQTPNEISETEIKRRAEAGWRDVRTARWKVFVPHAPPAHTKVDLLYSGEHAGSTAVREFIDTHQPDVTICGHIHEAMGEDLIGRTRVVNCGPGGKGHYAIIDLQGNVAINHVRSVRV
jgi:uncharacterized protein